MENLPKYKQTHLIENRRIDLACDYLIHEFRKIFHNITHEEAHRVVRKLAPDEASDDIKIRNFWNLFCSLSSGWQLKDLYNIVTAKNISWGKRETSVESLTPGTPQGWMKEIKPYGFDEAVNYLQSDEKKLKKALKKTADSRGKRAEGDEDDPIIAIQADAVFKVEDGNSRLMRKIENWVDEGAASSPPTIAAWVGVPKDGPSDLWIPTGSLFFMRSFMTSMGRSDVEIESKLKEISELALIEYRKRVKEY